MKNVNKCTIPLAAVLCISLLFSCTTTIDFPQQPAEDTSSSSQAWNYCVYPDIQQCYEGSYSTCPGGGILSAGCPFATASSSSESVGQSSSGAAPEYAYCVFATERMCLNGPVSSCPPGGVLSNNCPYSSSSSSLSGNLSSGVQQAYSSSTTPNTTPSSSSAASVGTTYYCDFGLRETCPSCANGVGGGCFEMEDQYGECDSRYGRVTTSCSTGLVCDWGYRYYDSSKSDCGSDYCGGCYVIGSGSGITVASCERDKGTVLSSCPESSLVLGTRPSSSSARPSSSSAKPSSSSSSATPVCGVDQFCSGAELLWNQTSIQGAINTANKCYFTKQITASNGNSGIGILINGKEINGTNCPSGNLLPNCPLLDSKVDGGYYIKLSKTGGYADIAMTADKPPCSGSSSSSGSDIYCQGATKIIDIVFKEITAQVEATTASAVCFRITGDIGGWTASNAQGRTCKANGGSDAKPDDSGNITQSSVKAINGYVYINCSAGNNSYFTMSPYK